MRYVLQQDQDDCSLLQFGCWFLTSNGAERCYDITHRECLAVVWVILLLRPHIDGGRFNVGTAHHALNWTLNLKEHSVRLTRWRLRRKRMEFDIEHRAGIIRQVADSLFCLPSTNGWAEAIDDEIPIHCIVHYDKKTISGTFNRE